MSQKIRLLIDYKTAEEKNSKGLREQTKEGYVNHFMKIKSVNIFNQQSQELDTLVLFIIQYQFQNCSSFTVSR